MNFLQRMFDGGKQPEKRNYTDAITQAIIQQANGTAAGISGAQEIAAGQVSRAFASCAVGGPDSALFNPLVMAKIGRDLIERGESVWEPHGAMLAWVQSYDIQPMTDGTYRYHVGTGNSRRKLSPVHVRYAFDAISGRGVGPLQAAPQLRQWAANLEMRMSEEGGAPVGYLLPIPTGGDDDSVDQLRKDLGGLKGRTALVETTAAGYGEGRAAAPHEDYRPRRIGPDIPQGNVEAFRAAQLATLAACGVPTELVERSDGTGQREAWRRFLHGTVQPLGRLAVQAASDAGLSIELDWDALMASDIAGRARAFGSLVQGGMAEAEAARVSGLVGAD